MKGRLRVQWPEERRTCRCGADTGTRKFRCRLRGNGEDGRGMTRSNDWGTRKFRRRLRVQGSEERRTCRCGATPQTADRADVKTTKRGPILRPAASGPTNASDGNSPVSNRTNEHQQQRGDNPGQAAPLTIARLWRFALDKRNTQPDSR